MGSNSILISRTKNLEEAFCELQPSAFPGETNFVAIYQVAKDLIVKQVLPEIKAIVASINSDIYLNDHGELHVKTVMLRASDLLRGTQESLSPLEGFILLMAILLHDAGHVINGRTRHEIEVSKLLGGLYGDAQLSSVDVALQRMIYSIAKAHAGKEDPIGRLTDSMSWSSQIIRMKRLAAILRLSDEFADDCLRANSYLLSSGNPHLSEASKIFHVYSLKLTSCDVDVANHEVTESFLLNRKDIVEKHPYKGGESFLVDYIYERAVKTFQEIIYCNRFFPETLRVSRLSIKIEFIEEKSYQEIREPISFRLQESGYPDHLFRSVFDLAPEGLHDSEGRKLDGQFIYSSLIVAETNE